MKLWSYDPGVRPPQLRPAPVIFLIMVVLVVLFGVLHCAIYGDPFKQPTPSPIITPNIEHTPTLQTEVSPTLTKPKLAAKPHQWLI
jgi:hypothetical protein